MKKIYEYSSDKSFLELIDNEHLKEQFVKITILDWEERPIQEVQGIVTGGNLNLDGNSNVRRTVNLSCYIDKEENANITSLDNLFSINKKMYLEIGYINTTNKYTNYDKIWFPQGTFVMIAPSLSHATGGASLQVSLRDKMCLLNGECGGVIPASTQFDQYETIDEDGNWVIEKPTFEQIIREVVNHFGGEQLGKIIISDVPSRIKKVMKWIGNTPLYLITITENEQTTYEMSTNYADTIGHAYQMFEYGEDIGYMYTDFTCPSELIGNAGDNVCVILDKIKNMLGNYEYFYDTEGNFHWQEIKNYLNTTKATIDLETMNKNDYLIDASKGKTMYEFNNSNLVTSFSNSPQFNKIKNDFVVWGIRKNANGNDVPIRYHLAIDTKPAIGNIYDVFFYEDPDDGLTKAKMPILYSSYAEIIKSPGAAGVYYKDTSTGTIYYWDGDLKQYVEVDSETTQFVKVQTTDWRSELYLQGVQAEPLGTDSNYYYTELMNEWPKLYNLQKDFYIDDKGETIYTGGFYDEVLKTPSDIDYYLDFIDSSAAISEFSVRNIGRRTQTVNRNDINCVFEPDIPDFVIIELGQPDTEEKRDECEAKGQNYIQVTTGIFNLLALGGTSNSAYNEIKMMLHEYTSYNESITIQSIPIYHLEPNTRIGVRDIESDIYGDYMISSISIPLDISSTMSISATRALERF